MNSGPGKGRDPNNYSLTKLNILFLYFIFISLKFADHKSIAIGDVTRRLKYAEFCNSGPGKGPQPPNKNQNCVLLMPNMLQKTVCKNINQKKNISQISEETLPGTLEPRGVV